MYWRFAVFYSKPCCLHFVDEETEAKRCQALYSASQDINQKSLLIQASDPTIHTVATLLPHIFSKWKLPFPLNNGCDFWEGISPQKKKDCINSPAIFLFICVFIKTNTLWYTPSPWQSHKLKRKKEIKPCPSCKFSYLENRAEVIQVKKLLDWKNYPKGCYHTLAGLQDQSFLVSACFDAHISEKLQTL